MAPPGDTLLGGSGDDYIDASIGTVGAWIEGGSGNDVICGTAENDTIIGGTGDKGLQLVLADAAAAGPDSTDGWAAPTVCMATPTYTAPIPGTISGQVYSIDTGNGLDDWTVSLEDQGVVVATQVTGDQDLNGDGTIEPSTESGLYTFTGVDPGVYTVVATLKSGYVQVTTTTTVTLTDDQNATDAAIGVHFQSATIEGRVFNDVNGSGLDDPTDPGVNDWQIQLLDPSGNVVATQLTSGTGASAGDYSFAGLMPGTYTVVETPEPDWVQSYPALQPVAPTVSLQSVDGVPVTPAAPSLLVVTSTAQNLSGNNTNLDVGDTVQFTVTVSNPTVGTNASLAVVNVQLPDGGFDQTTFTPSQTGDTYASGIWTINAWRAAPRTRSPFPQESVRPA